MGKDNRFFLFIEIGLGILALFFTVLLFQPENPEHRVAVIISHSDDSSWNQFTEGMKQAAQEENLRLVIVGTGDISGAEEERILIEQEIDDGADALVIQPAPGDGTESMLKDAARGLPVVLVPAEAFTGETGGSRKKTDAVGAAGKADGDGSDGGESRNAEDPDREIGGFPVIGPDHYAMGQALASMLMEDYGGSLEEKQIGIVNHSMTTVPAVELENGFLDGIEGSGCNIIWSLHGLDQSGQPEREITNQVGADIVVALDTFCLEAAGADAEARRIRGAVVYGVGSSEKVLYYLDHDNIRGIIFPNGFHIGYQCMQEITAKLNSRFYTMRSAETSWKAVRRDDLFTEENEDLLFMRQ